MNATDVIGWAYDADLHCWDCARGRFGDRIDQDDPDNPLEDFEGNEVHPIFAGDCEESEYCGDCGDPIYELDQDDSTEEE